MEKYIRKVTRVDERSLSMVMPADIKRARYSRALKARRQALWEKDNYRRLEEVTSDVCLKKQLQSNLVPVRPATHVM